MGRGFMVKANVSKAVFDCLRQMNAYDKRTSNAIRQIVKVSTANVHKGAVNRAPKRTGKLKKSIRMEFKDSAKNTVGIVYSNDPVAHLVEFGAGPVPVVRPIRKKALHPGGSGYFFTKATIPARAAKPFLKPAMDAERATFEVKIEEALKNGKV